MNTKRESDYLYSTDLPLRMGKTYLELDNEFESIYDSYKICRKDFLRSTSTNFHIDEKINSMIESWKSYVYTEICKRTGEVKNQIVYSASGKYFKIGHEIEGWKDLSILSKFCTYSKIPYDEIFNASMMKKLAAISSLTIILWFEIFDISPGPQFRVGANIIKPEDRQTLSDFLEGSVEKTNILTWFNANLPVPLEFGMNIGDYDCEFISGFYIFDGTPQANLSKALTGLQAYGAEINKSNIDVFKSIPGEELKVYFNINKYGVQKVALNMIRLPDENKKMGIMKLDKEFDNNLWEKFETLFGELTIKKYLILQFSADGWEIMMKREVGAEIGSKVYIDDFHG